MMIDAQNKKGGLLGKKLEAVVVDPASDWPLFAEKARAVAGKGQSRRGVRMLDVGFQKIGAAGFRKGQRLALLPGSVRRRRVVEERDLYRRRAEPAGHSRGRLPDEGSRREAVGARRNGLRLPAHHQQDSRSLPAGQGREAADISINYTPFGYSDWQTRVAAIKKFGSAGKKTAVVSTINGDANVPFYKELGNQKISAEDIPVVAFSVGEEELSGLDTKPLVGHLAAWNYFESINTPANKAFINQWHTFIKNPKRTTNDPDGGALHRLQSVGEGGAEGRNRPTWKRCSRRSPAWKRRTSPAASPRCCRTITSPSRSTSARCERTASSTWFGNPPARCRAMPGPTILPGSKNIEADWVTLKCGNYNKMTKKCSGQNYK